MPVDPSTTWILYVWRRNDGALARDFRTGDVGFIFPGTMTPGTQDVKSFLVVRIPIPPNAEQVKEDWERPEAETTIDGEQVIARKARYALNFQPSFTEAEMELINTGAGLPNGPTAFGGTVVAGVVEGLFTATDVYPKGLRG
jgi:hypothetical protein